MKYTISIERSAQKQFERLHKDVQSRVDKKILDLADNPRPQGVEKLSGVDHLYRVRVGDYRIIYQIRDKELIVLVVKIGHRREVYR